MDIEDKRRTLRQYEAIRNEYEYAFNRYIEFCKSKYNKIGVTAVNYSHELKPKNDYRGDFTDVLDEVIDQEEELLVKMVNSFKQEISYRERLDNAIENLSEIYPDIARVLAFRYLDCYKIREVAEKMNISEDTVKRKQKKGLELIEL